MIISSLPLFLVFVTFTHGSGTDLRMDIVDDGLTGLIHNEVNVSCVSNMTQEVFLIGVAKKKPEPTGLSESTLGNDIWAWNETKLQEGQMSKTKKPDYLTLTITSPGLDDLGSYVCLLEYVDDEGNLAQARATADVTIDNLGILGFVEQMKTSVSMLTHKIEYQELKMIQQQTLINEQNNTLNHLHHQIQQDNTNFNVITHQVQQQNTTFSGFRHQLEQRLENLQGKVMAYSSKGQAIAFTVYSDSDIKFKNGDTLLYRDVELNLGNGYNPKTGVFTAPQSGLYSFTLTVTTEKKGHYAYVDVIANGKLVGRVYTRDEDTNGDQSSLSVTLRLAKGGRVYPKVVNTNTDHLGGWDYNIFTGYLVHGM